MLHEIRQWIFTSRTLCGGCFAEQCPEGYTRVETWRGCGQTLQAGPYPDSWLSIKGNPIFDPPPWRQLFLGNRMGQKFKLTCGSNAMVNSSAYDLNFGHTPNRKVLLSHPQSGCSLSSRLCRHIGSYTWIGGLDNIILSIVCVTSLYWPFTTSRAARFRWILNREPGYQPPWGLKTMRWCVLASNCTINKRYNL